MGFVIIIIIIIIIISSGCQPFGNIGCKQFLELYGVIKSSNLKSSELDPLPPFIFINVLDDLAPFLVYLFNMSLVEGHLPASQKQLIVFPTLKTPNLEPNTCLNYGTDQFLIFRFFLKPLKDSSSNKWVVCLLYNLASDLIILLKLLFHLFCLRYIWPLTTLTCRF